MKFDFEQHFENISPPQSEMAEEACKRKPPWGLSGNGQPSEVQLKHWKETAEPTNTSQDNEANGTVPSTSNGIHKVEESQDSSNGTDTERDSQSLCCTINGVSNTVLETSVLCEHNCSGNCSQGKSNTDTCNSNETLSQQKNSENHNDLNISHSCVTENGLKLESLDCQTIDTTAEAKIKFSEEIPSVSDDTKLQGNNNFQCSVLLPTKSSLLPEESSDDVSSEMSDAIPEITCKPKVQHELESSKARDEVTTSDANTTNPVMIEENSTISAEVEKTDSKQISEQNRETTPSSTKLPQKGETIRDKQDDSRWSKDIKQETLDTMLDEDEDEVLRKLTDLDQSNTPISESEVLSGVSEESSSQHHDTQDCSIELDSHEVTRYLSARKRKRKVELPKKNNTKKKKAVSPDAKKPKIITRRATRINPNLAEPEIPTPMLNNRVRLELRRLQLDPLPEKRDDLSPEPPKKPKRRGKYARIPPKTPAVTIKPENQDEIQVQKVESKIKIANESINIVRRKVGRPKKSFLPTSMKKESLNNYGIKKTKVHNKTTFLNLLKKLKKIEMRQKKLGKGKSCSNISPKEIKLKGPMKKSPDSLLRNKAVSREHSPIKKKTPSTDQSSPSDETRKRGRPPKFLGTSTPTPLNMESPEVGQTPKLGRRRKAIHEKIKIDTTDVITECEIKIENPALQFLNSTKCNLCKKVFAARNKFYMRRHLASVHGLEPFCKRCSTIFESNQDLLNHTQNCDAKHDNQNKRLLAALQRSKRKKNIEFIEPEDEPLGINSILCPYCNKIINHKQNLRRHIQSYHPELEEGAVCYTCPYCHKIVANKYNLQRHMTVIHKGEAFCKYCWELFNTFSELKVHLVKCRSTSQYSKKKRKWECPWESKSINITQTLFEFDIPAPEENIAESLQPSLPTTAEEIDVDCDDTLEDSLLYGDTSQNNEVDCDISEFYMPEVNTDISFVLSEVVEIITTDEDICTSELTRVLACDNIISIPPESITHDKGIVNVSLEKGVRIVNGGNWNLESELGNEESVDIGGDLHTLPLLTLRKPNIEEGFHTESGSHEEDDRIYQVL